MGRSIVRITRSHSLQCSAFGCAPGMTSATKTDLAKKTFLSHNPADPWVAGADARTARFLLTMTQCRASPRLVCHPIC